jgi:hypothetical protein
MGQTGSLGTDALEHVIDEPEKIIGFLNSALKSVYPLETHEFIMLIAFEEIPVSG